MLRATLAAAEPKSITLVEIGLATNLVDLLRSGGGDAHSPLTGEGLIARSVSQLVWSELPPGPGLFAPRSHAPVARAT